MRDAHRVRTAADWNRRFPVGTPVRYFPARNRFDHLETQTRSDAWTLGGGDAVVLVEGRSGGVSLDHLIVVGTEGA